MKETTNKLIYELDFEFIEQLAQRMNDNKHKYPLGNWHKPIDPEELKQAMFRHVIAIMKGEYKDDNREHGHLEAVALNAMFINYQLKKQTNEDYYNPDELCEHP